MPATRKPMAGTLSRRRTHDSKSAVSGYAAGNRESCSGVIAVLENRIDSPNRVGAKSPVIRPGLALQMLLVHR